MRWRDSCGHGSLTSSVRSRRAVMSPRGSLPLSSWQPREGIVHRYSFERLVVIGLLLTLVVGIAVVAVLSSLFSVA